MAEGHLKTGYLSMQVSRNELQKVRVKLTREALTIQKEGSAYSSPSVDCATNQASSNTLSWIFLPSSPMATKVYFFYDSPHYYFCSGENEPGLGTSVSVDGKKIPPGERSVTVVRRKAGGLGMSIRGGKESNLPVAISKIYKDQAAADTNQLFEGDIILKVNGKDISNANHDEAVAALKKGGTEVTLTVRHASSGGLKHEKQANGIVRSIEESSSGSRKSSEAGESGSSSSLQSNPWTDNIVLPLTMASITRYKNGGDDLRHNAFEVSSMDGGASVVLYSENTSELFSWYTSIKDRIAMLLDQSMVMSSSSLPPSEQIVYMGWAWERLKSTSHWNVWKRKFIAIKGAEFYIFDFPPVLTRDWLRSEFTYNLMDVVFHVFKDDELLDKRENCFCVQSGGSDSHYISVDTESDMLEIAKRMQKATHQAVSLAECRTFPGKWRNRSAKLVLDLKRGLRLYSADDRSLLWQYRFSYLRGSSDDGHSRIVLLFSPSPAGPFERQELEFANMQQVLTVMHAFYAARVAQVDPHFVFENTL